MRTVFQAILSVSVIASHRFCILSAEQQLNSLPGVYCGNNVPSELPQAERYWLKFRSNSDAVGSGFLAQYTYGIRRTVLSFIFPVNKFRNFVQLLLSKLLVPVV